MFFDCLFCLQNRNPNWTNIPHGGVFLGGCRLFLMGSLSRGQTADEVLFVVFGGQGFWEPAGARSKGTPSVLSRVSFGCVNLCSEPPFFRASLE